ncbi:MAG: cellulase family glycosylhydrolase [Spirochaetaceae bacterium]|jgi:hypothetical protein|nr:cellulase family glycosylhydrolase [Spirochaetaceae bacterium]
MKIEGNRIVDEEGRTLLLRGCNLGGSSKYPLSPPGETRRPDSLAATRDLSFVGRPFPEEAAEDHFERLRCWGFTFIRLILTWEALEHEGPGIYDEAYLAYLRKILLAAEKKGIAVFIDPHQDVWSRWTGGDGAPAWTLEMLGFDLEKLDAVGAAVTEQNHRRFNRDPYPPRMIWPTNYNRYAAATMFTLFFGGNTYAPGLTVEGEPVQEWLQGRYIAAMRHAYRRLKNCKAIVGWGSMNEPHPGFIGYRDLEGLENYPLAAGPMPSPFAAMAAASGHRVSVPFYSTRLPGMRSGRRLLNPQGLSLFKEGFVCPWKQAGVWTDEGGEVRLLRRDHFSSCQGKPVRFVDDFLKPFMRRFTSQIREVRPGTMIFIEGIPQGDHPHWTGEDPSGVVNAFHWYDGFILYMKSFRSWFSLRSDTGKPLLGRKRIAAYFREQIGKGAAWTRDRMGDIPALLGEFGLPFDMNGKRAFRTGDYRLHEEALALYYDAIDAHLLHSTIWNYTADNTHERGDGWNGEDFSIFCNGEGRAAAGWLRPYPLATAGVPLALNWDRKRRLLSYRFRADGGEAPTEIYAPPECLGEKPLIRLQSAAASGVVRAEYRPEDRRLLIFSGGYTGEVDLQAEGILPA